jgi:hypothetical protein
MDDLSLPRSIVALNDGTIQQLNMLDPFVSSIDEEQQQEQQLTGRKRTRILANTNQTHRDNIDEANAMSIRRDSPTAVVAPMVYPNASASSGLKILQRHHLEDVKTFTAGQLIDILKTLSLSVRNQKSQRMESLKQYFLARSDEVIFFG